MTIVAAYSGTFDPVTYGHYDIIKRAAKMFPKLIVAVGSNIAKNPKFTLEERIALIRKVSRGLKNVEVQGFSGLVVDFAREQGVLFDIGRRDFRLRAIVTVFWTQSTLGVQQKVEPNFISPIVPPNSICCG